MNRTLMLCPPFAPSSLPDMEELHSAILVDIAARSAGGAAFVTVHDSHATDILPAPWVIGEDPRDRAIRSAQQLTRELHEFQTSADVCRTTYAPETLTAAAVLLSRLPPGVLTEHPVASPYCVKCRQFLLAGTGNRCSRCDRPAVPQSTHHLFVRLSEMSGDLACWLDRCVCPTNLMAQLQATLRHGLPDIDITDDRPLFTMPIPGRYGQSFGGLYRVVAALLAGTQAAGARHGADIGDYWLTEGAEVIQYLHGHKAALQMLTTAGLLLAGGYRPPTRLVICGRLTINGLPPSGDNDEGRTTEPLRKSVGAEFLRFAVASKTTTCDEDINLDLEEAAARWNRDVAVSGIRATLRWILTAVTDHCGGCLGQMDGPGRTLIGKLISDAATVVRRYSETNYAEVIRLLSADNHRLEQYLEDNPPGRVAARNPEAAQTILTTGFNALRILVTLYSPILPRLAEEFARTTGQSTTLLGASFEEIIENQGVRDTAIRLPRPVELSHAAVVRG
jgi:methionyl-tRNA synthetase